MMVAQQLYEGITLGAQGHQGLITYMRTDSTRISPVAQAAAAEYIVDKFGEPYSKHGSKIKKIRQVHKMPMKRFVHQMFLIHLNLFPSILIKIS